MAEPIESVNAERNWSPSNPMVKRLIRWLRKRQRCTPGEVVAWDAAHGKQLFTWDNRRAAEEYRVHEARLFLSTFWVKIDGMRVKAFVNVCRDPEIGIPQRCYMTADSVEDPIRDKVVEELQRKLRNIEGQIRFWKLTKHKRWRCLADLIAQLVE